MDNLDRPRCGHCGRFINFKDRFGVVYTPYGNSYDEGPPYEVFICGFCYETYDEGHRELIRSISYIGPHRICDAPRDLPVEE